MFNNHNTHDRCCCVSSGRRYAGSRLRDAAARWVRGRSLLLLLAVLALGAPAAAADPVGQVSEFSSGLNAGSYPALIAPGADGNLWFTDNGTTTAIGRITPSGHDHRVLKRPERRQLPGRDRVGSGRQPVVRRPGTTGRSGGSPRAVRSPSFTRPERRQLPDRDRAGSGRQPVVHRQGTTKAIGRITPSGQITEFSSGLNAGSVPAVIAPGPDGNLWFTDDGGRRRSGGSPRTVRSPSSPAA